jgi:hypothetical protein
VQGNVAFEERERRVHKQGDHWLGRREGVACCEELLKKQSTWKGGEKLYSTPKMDNVQLKWMRG